MALPSTWCSGQLSELPVSCTGSDEKQEGKNVIYNDGMTCSMGSEFEDVLSQLNNEV